MTTPPVALTIAGSDSGGGAGVQADLKSFAAHGVFGASVFTALTAQNTVGVQGVHAIPLDFVDAQIESVLSDFKVAAVKTGMLATSEIVSAVARHAARGRFANLVVDPVMVASSGDRLLDADAESTYLSELMPHAKVITPNAVEAGVLVGAQLATVTDLRNAAVELAGCGAEIIVVKGGHIDDGPDAVDVVWDGRDFTELRARWVDTKNNHGTGCSFGSAIAACLARGDRPLDAVRTAKDYVNRGMQSGASWKLGAGHGPIDHFPDRTG